MDRHSHTKELARPRRATLRQALAEGGAEARAALDGLAADGPHGAVLVERLRFGPPETWRGWLPGHGPVAVKLWPADQPQPALPMAIHAGVAPLLAQGPHWRLFAWIAGETLAAALRRGHPR
ncbi:MAG: hypothetical protein NVV74_14510 [Magnetospirillum sp.]|nr:hypothetical protein [Magnetospirillum sp.]